MPALPRAACWSAAAAAALHTGAVLWAWGGWGRGLRGGLLVWIDLPVSLFFLGATGRSLLLWSLVAGGLQWAVLGALLGWAAGRLSRRTPAA